MFRSSSDHVRFKETSFEEDVVILQSFEGIRKNLFSNSLTVINRVFTVTKNFRFNNRDQSVFLADGSVSSQSPGVFLHSLRGRASGFGVNLQDGSPFSESASFSIKVRSHFSQGVQSFGGGFTVGQGDFLYSLINFDTSNYSLFVQLFNEIFAFRSGVVN